MWQRFTEPARRVVLLAQQEATKRNSPAVESEHLLAGLMLEPGTIVTQIFDNLAGPVKPMDPLSLQRALKDKTIEPSLMQRALKDANERDALLSPPEVKEIGSHFKVDPELVRRIEALVLAKLRAQNDNPDIQLSAQAKRTLELAADEARRTQRLLKHSNFIGTEHLLLGLLRQEDSAAALSLNQAGLDLDRARELVLEHMQTRNDEAA